MRAAACQIQLSCTDGHKQAQEVTNLRLLSTNKGYDISIYITLLRKAGCAQRNQVEADEVVRKTNIIKLMGGAHKPSTRALAQSQ